MFWDNRNIFTTMNAESVEKGTYGYFSNVRRNLVQAVEEGKSNSKAVYSRLEYVLEDNVERRFGNSMGNFSLFYRVDNSDMERY